jgi:hypothetical protein
MIYNKKGDFMSFRVEVYGVGKHERKKLWLKPNEYKNGIEYALKNNITSLFLTHDDTEKYYSIDFAWLKELPEIDELQFMIPLSKQSNIDGIYELKKLKTLSYFSNYDRMPLNHSKLNSLEYLYTNYSKNHKNRESDFESLENLKTLRLWRIKDEENCNFLGKIKKLNRLELTWNRTIKTLEGIENNKLLNELSLINLSQLKDVFALSKLQPLKYLWIENCKNINDNGIKMLEDKYLKLRSNIYCTKNKNLVKTNGT